MLLSEMIQKPIFVNNKPRGMCLGVGISTKSGAVKYLLCSSEISKNTRRLTADFAVNVSAVLSIENEIRLSALRPVFPKNCAKIFPELPVYSADGGFLGKIVDLQLQDDFTATMIFTDKTAAYPVSALLACSDAVLLKKEQAYPIGQPVPAPFLLQKNDKKYSVVTRPVLRAAIAQGELIKLTLSLAPFSLIG